MKQSAHLPQTILQQAVIGTDLQKHLLSPDSVIDKIVIQASTQYEAQLLLKTAGLALRRQAGYRPGHDNETLPHPCPIDDYHPINTESAQYLISMLATRYHIDALPEWCMHVALTGQHAPEELIPWILDSGYKTDHLRDSLGLLLRQRGKWLAEMSANPRWKWALAGEIPAPPGRFFPDSRKEAAIIRSFASQSVDNMVKHEGLNQLGTHQMLWSTVLARVFIQALQDGNVIASTEPRYTLSLVLDLCGYYFPLEYSHMLLNLLAQGGDNWQERAHTIHMVFKWRAEARTALYKSVTVEQTGQPATRLRTVE